MVQVTKLPVAWDE